MIGKILASILVLGLGMLLLQNPRGSFQTEGQSLLTSFKAESLADAPTTRFQVGENNGDWSREIVLGSPTTALENFQRECRDKGLPLENSKVSDGRAMAWSQLHNGQRWGMMAVEINPTHVAIYHFRESSERGPSSTERESTLFAQIPEPPWSKPIFNQQTHAGQRQIKMFQCEGGGPEIARYYREKFKILGWEEIFDRGASPSNEEFISFRQAQKVCFVQIDHGTAQSLVTLVLDNLPKS